MTPPPPSASSTHADAAPPAPSAPSAASGRVLHNLMRDLRLENFMLHEVSRVDFSAPITLITGANGSGKTQILDALLLCLGARSQRIRRQGIGELVGPAGDTARVTLALNNPQVRADGRVATESDGPGEGKTATLRFRPLTTGHRDTDRLTDDDVIHVIIEMSRDSDALKYRLGPPGKERNVTAGTVERLFSQAGVSPRNSLAFTEEGTIGNFTSDSPQKQFEQFLETTSLLDLRRTLVNVHGEVGNCQGRLDPVQQQYMMHRTMLEHMRSDLDNLDKRDELEARARALQCELAWSKVHALSKEAEDTTAMRDAQREREKVQTEARDRTTKQIEDVRKQIEELSDALEHQQVQSKNRAMQLGDTKARLDAASDSAAGITRGIEKLGAQIAKLIDDVDPAHIQHVSAATDAAAHESEQLAADLRALDKEIATQRAASMRSLRDGLPGSVLSGRGLQTLIQCLQLRTAGEAAGLFGEGGTCFGPLVVEWSLKPRLNKDVKDLASRAVPALLSDLLADFLAASKTAHDKLLKLVTKTFRKPPPVRMHLAPDATAASELPKQLKDTAVALEDLLVAPDAVLALVRSRPAAMITDPKLDHAAAQQLAAQTGRTLWLPDGCVVTATSLQWPDSASTEVADHLTAGIDALSAAATALGKVQELLPRKDELAAQQTAAAVKHQDLRGKLDRLETTLRQADGLREERAQLEQSLEKSRKLQQKLGKEIEDLEARERDDTKRKDTAAKLDKARSKRADLESREAACQRDIEGASRRASDLEVQLTARMQEVQDAKLAASALGAAPGGEKRASHLIEQDLNQTLGTLEGLRRVTRTREEYELQKAHVDQLQKEVEQARGHLESLQGDLESRLAEWDRELTERLTGAQRVLKHLLRDDFEDVRLGVRDAIRRGRKNPADDLTGGGALDFRVQRRNNRLLNLSGLCGGEKVLVVEGLIFALHCLTDSPVHALDEFTQKLDVQFKSAAFRMALDAVAWARAHSRSFFAPQFVLLCPDTLGIEISSADVSHVVVVRAEAALDGGRDGGREHQGVSRVLGND